MPYTFSDDLTFGELRVFFDSDVWIIHKHGLIYSDNAWLDGLKIHLIEDLHLSHKAANDIDYSEQGMQGDTFVSLDVGEFFLKEFKELFF